MTKDSWNENAKQSINVSGTRLLRYIVDYKFIITLTKRDDHIVQLYINIVGLINKQN